MLASVSRLLDLDEVRDRTRIGSTLLYRLMAQGELPFIKIGDRRLIDEADLVAFINRRRSAPRLETAALR